MSRSVLRTDDSIRTIPTEWLLLQIVSNSNRLGKMRFLPFWWSFLRNRLEQRFGVAVGIRKVENGTRVVAQMVGTYPTAIGTFGYVRTLPIRTGSVDGFVRFERTVFIFFFSSTLVSVDD